MPELPEVEAARRAIEENCIGKKIKRSIIADDPKVIDGVSPSHFQASLLGKTIVAAHRKGKNMWLQLDSPPFPSFQFGMAGAVYIKGVAVTKYKRPNVKVLQKDVKNLVAKQIFARWQTLLAIFDFDIEFIKGNSNSLPDQGIPSGKTSELAHQPMAQLPLGSKPDQTQGNGLASPQQMARGKDKSNLLDWLEALPKSPGTRKMVVRRSLWDRYLMHDPSIGPPLFAPPPYQFLVEYTIPNPGCPRHDRLGCPFASPPVCSLVDPLSVRVAFGQPLFVLLPRLPTLLRLTEVARLCYVLATENTARIHPLQIASSLSKDSCVALHKCIKEVIEKAVEVGADSSQFPSGWIFHVREKKPGKAFVDGKKIEFIIAGGRTTAYVPELQKLNGSQSVKARIKPRKGAGKGSKDVDSDGDHNEPESEEEENTRSTKSKGGRGKSRQTTKPPAKRKLSSRGSKDENDNSDNDDDDGGVEKKKITRARKTVPAPRKSKKSTTDLDESDDSKNEDEDEDAIEKKRTRKPKNAAVERKSKKSAAVGTRSKK
ncbi:formamidopyrimidine-DNA glycosylase [Diospyros lotus]|uniref:formamidopyrimidine-DNA glycosylase n=1 Tax=Diospyros lotus TaxID=55363 RepID=UPI0022568196|nr:formamidopyrimidine-DNA glycosylase [Diospyros lotus]